MAIHPSLRALLLLGLVSAAACAAPQQDEAETSEPTATSVSEVASSVPATDADYESVEHLHDAALKQGLLELIKNHRSLGYDNARKVLMRATSPGGKIECVYTGRLATPDGTTTPGDFNTEHTWPQSQGADREPARSDMHHLFPVDARTNSARGNHPFGEVTCLDASGPACAFANGGSALGKTREGATAFEVRAEKRGDVARAQFYFSVRYGKPIAPIVEATLKRWHHEDPVDEVERARNALIAENQRNRNPFVDREEFVDQIADF